MAAAKTSAFMVGLPMPNGTPSWTLRLGRLRRVRLRQTSKQPQQSVENRQGVRRAARYVEIHRDHGGGAAKDLLVSGIGTAGNRAGPHRDHDARRRDGIVGLAQRP